MVIVLRCSRQIFHLSDFFLHVGDFQNVKNRSLTSDVSYISKVSSTHYITNIRQQHRGSTLLVYYILLKYCFLIAFKISQDMADATVDLASRDSA